MATRLKQQVMIVKIIDIQHTANGRGPYRKSKVGDIYRLRKQFLYDFTLLTPFAERFAKKHGLEMQVFTLKHHKLDLCLYTTPYVGFKVIKGSSEQPEEIEIQTENSFYICKVI